VPTSTVQVSPRDPEGHGRRVNIQTGLSNREIAAHLHDNGIIRSATAFDLYLRLSGSGGQLQAGTYVLSPAQPLPEIVSYLVEGRVDPLTVTVPPGLTVDELADHLAEEYGYGKPELETALEADYDHPLLSSKPASASLEGYIFPETYEVGGDSSVTALFELAFDVMWERIQDDRLDRAVRSQGFTLHEAVTLASVIERESRTDEQRQVSQIFQLRLDRDMPLEADATFVYAAKQLGVTPRINLDSPYNTRLYGGLPPGPISNFNLHALEAVANPARGNYLYFVHGDDGNIYYAHTLDEHEENASRYCIELCSMF
jgi:UPF0755 protein